MTRTSSSGRCSVTSAHRLTLRRSLATIALPIIHETGG